MASRTRAGRRSAILCVVTAGHVALVLLLIRWDEASTGRISRSSSDQEMLLLLDFSTRSTAASVVPRMAARRAPPTRGRRLDVSASLVSPAAPASAAPSDSAAASDWYDTGDKVAKGEAARILAEIEHVCHDADLRGEVRPECRRYKKPEPWEPERKYGFSGGLPFVYLGKRCVLGLGFFGCAVGKLPGPNGHVLDDMRNPNRPRDSVPDPN